MNKKRAEGYQVRHPACKRARRSPWVLRTCAVLFALGIATVSTGADATRLTVTVQDIRSERGEIKLALYASSESFSEFSAELASQTAKARQGMVTITFENLVPGQYAIAAYHDENGNGDFDTNFLGLPQEGYGFGNDAPVVLGPPTFADAAVSVRGDREETSVSIIY